MDAKVLLFGLVRHYSDISNMGAFSTYDDCSDNFIHETFGEECEVIEGQIECDKDYAYSSLEPLDKFSCGEYDAVIQNMGSLEKIFIYELD